MLKATVTGRIWSTKKVAEVPAGSILDLSCFKLVEVEDRSSDGSEVLRRHLYPLRFVLAADGEDTLGLVLR